MPQEEAAAFLRGRGQCWLDHLWTEPAMRAFAEAARMHPRLPGVQCAWAIASVLDRAVKCFGRAGLFATPAAEVTLPPSEQPWEPQVRPLAIEQLRRIVTNYQARGLAAASTSEFVVCQS